MQTPADLGAEQMRDEADHRLDESARGVVHDYPYRAATGGTRFTRSTVVQSGVEAHRVFRTISPPRSQIKNRRSDLGSAVMGAAMPSRTACECLGRQMTGRS